MSPWIGIAVAAPQKQEADIRQETAAEQDLSCTGLSVCGAILCGIKKIFLWLLRSSLADGAHHPRAHGCVPPRGFCVFLLPPLPVITNTQYQGTKKEGEL